MSGQHWPGGTGAGLPSGQTILKQATSPQSAPGPGGPRGDGDGGDGDGDGVRAEGGGGGHSAWLGQQVPGGTGARDPS